MPEKTEKCVNADCNCPAPAGGDYCSDYCSGENDAENGCLCGHPECHGITAPGMQHELRESLE